MYVPAAVVQLSLRPSRIIARKSKPIVFCSLRTLFKSPYPSHSIGLTASGTQNVISSRFTRLRTLLKTGSSANLFESAPCALFRKNMGGRGYIFQTERVCPYSILRRRCAKMRRRISSTLRPRKQALHAERKREGNAGLPGRNRDAKNAQARHLHKREAKRDPSLRSG